MSYHHMQPNKLKLIIICSSSSAP